MTAPYRPALVSQRRASLVLALALTLPSFGEPMAALAFSTDSLGSYPLLARGGGGGG